MTARRDPLDDPLADPLDRRFAHFCRTGDAQALGTVFDATARELLHVALWLCGNRVDAEDLLQRTFLCAIETRGKFAPDAAAMPWLMGLLANEARRLRRERARVPNAPPSERLRDPEGEAAARELAATVREVAEQLAPAYRDVLTLHLEQGCNAKEIADRLQRPAGTVRTQLMRGLQLLRRRLPIGFVAGVLPLPPSASALAVLREQVLARALTHHAGAAATASPLALTTAGGSLMTKKLAVFAPVLALLLGIGAWSLWPESPTPVTPPSPPPVAAATAERTPTEAIAAAAQAPERTAQPQPAGPADAGFASLHVTVRWSDDSTPAAGVGVYALDENYTALLRRDAVTDAEGRCELRHLRPGRAHVSGSHTERVATVELRAGDGNTVELRAQRTAIVRGRVVDADGRPVADARIWLSDSSTWRSGHELARSAADGTFAVPLAADHYLGARKQGHGESLLRWINAPSAPKEPIELQLRAAGGTIRGTVRDPRGEPVAWAKVLVGGLFTTVVPANVFAERQSMPMGQLVTSDEHGDYAAEGVAAGVVDVRAWAGDFAPWSGGVELAPGAEARVDVAFAPGAVVTGTAHTSDGAPLANVQIESDQPEDQFAPSTRSGADGRYRLAGLPGGPLLLRAAHEQLRATTSLQLTAGGKATWDPVLAALRTIEGVVLDPDARPLANLEVGCADPQSPVNATTRTDERGRFTLQPDGDQPLRVVVERDDIELAAIDDVRPGTQDLVIRLRPDDLPSAHITLRVVDERGQPIAAKLGPKRRGATHWRLLDNDAATGKGKLGPLPAGDYEINVMSNGFGDLALPPVQLAAQQTLDLGDIVLRAPGRATFAVLAPAGVPLDRTMLVLYGERGEFLANLQVEQGRAEAKALRPGRAFVWCTCAGGEAGATIDVPSAGVVHCDLTLQRVVRSTLRFRRSAAWTKQSSVKLFAFRPDGSFAVLGGTVPGREPQSLLELPPGRYRVECRADDGAHATVDLTVPMQNPGPTLDVDLLPAAK